MSTPYAAAQEYVGKHEQRDEAALRDFLYTGGQNLSPATRAWCADFVNATLGRSGVVGTGSGLARSFLGWGQAVDKPQEGDVAVFSRGRNPAAGHVGYYAGPGSTPDTVRVLGGNQGDAVSYAEHPISRLLGYRRAGTPQPDTPSAQVVAASVPPTPSPNAPVAVATDTAPAATPSAQPSAPAAPSLAGFLGLNTAGITAPDKMPEIQYMKLDTAPPPLPVMRLARGVMPSNMRGAKT